MNVVFKSIEIRNFLSLGDCGEVALSERGFTIVSGRNLESSMTQSNGSGKSSIFDAIFWTLTGDTLRGAGNIVNENTSGGCKCTLTIEVDDNCYKIVRTKSDKELGNSCLFYENGELLSDQSKKSQEIIYKTIPVLSTEILGSIVLLGQGLPYKFSSLSPIKRKDLLETMSGSSSKIERVKYLIEEEGVKYSSELQGLERKVLSLNSEIKGLEKSVEVLESQRDSYKSSESINEEIKSIKTKIEENQSVVSDLEDRIKTYSDLRLQLSSFIDNTSRFLSGIDFQITSIDTTVSGLKVGCCPTCGRPYDDQEGSQKALQNAQEERSRLVSKRDMILSKINRARSQMNDFADKESNLRNQVTSLGYTNNGFETKISELTKLLSAADSLSKKIDEVSTEIKTRRISVNDISKEIDNVKQYVDCVDYLKRQVSRDFKGYVLEEVIKFLSTRSSYYGKYLFSDDRDVNVTLSGNKILISVGSRLYENLSGGERQRVDLAVQFALRDMLVITSGFSCNLLVLDEAFDNLDAKGSESLVRLIVSEFSDINSVFVVTHHSSIAIPYDNSIVVTKNSRGISEISEEVI